MPDRVVLTGSRSIRDTAYADACDSRQPASAFSPSQNRTAGEVHRAEPFSAPATE